MTIQSVIDSLRQAKAQAAQLTATIDQALSEALDLQAPPILLPLLCCSPVTGFIEPDRNIWGGQWWDASPYGTKYLNNSNDIHTGADLNGPGDSGHTVYCVADGRIVFSGSVQNWQAKVIVVEHVDAGTKVWTRYAHISNIRGLGVVSRGDPIGVIADYTPVGSGSGDHLHYDAARIDLGAKPGDWPGADLARVLRDYYNPAEFHKSHNGAL